MNTEEINVINLTATLQKIARGVTFFWPPTVLYSDRTKKRSALTLIFLRVISFYAFLIEYCNWISQISHEDSLIQHT
jgi:hypothetical protein